MTQRFKVKPLHDSLQPLIILEHFDSFTSEIDEIEVLCDFDLCSTAVKIWWSCTHFY